MKLMRVPPAATQKGPVRLGVVMLCHEQMRIAARVIRVWSAAGCPLAIHIDSKTGAHGIRLLQRRLAGLENVHLIRRRNCEWGMFSLVEATQEAASLLLEQHPELTHVLLVSGSCLPLRPVSDLLAYLALDPARDYIESVTAADVGWTVGGLNEERFTLRFPFSWRKRRKLFDRYVELQRKLKLYRHPPEGVVPHLGSQWWCLTRRTLSAILDDPRRAEFDRYFRRVWISDESYFQTLARRHSTSIESRSLTLSKFDSQGKPYIFYDDHQAMLEESGCFIARKIWPRASVLFDAFPLPATDPPSAREPRPAHLDRLISRAVERRRLGRPGLYMQSRFPRKDAENGKTAGPYVVFQGFDDVFPDFRDWMAARLNGDLHGHLFSAEQVEFADGGEIGPGCLSNSPKLRQHDSQGFLASLIRITAPRMQGFLLSPRDEQPLDWFMVTDPNATILAVTGAWVLPLMQSDMPFDDVRRVAGRLQRAEEAQLEVLHSVWVKARIHVWDLADFIARPAAILQQVLRDLGSPAAMDDDLPQMRPAGGTGAFLQALRNAGLQPRLIGDFPAPPHGIAPASLPPGEETCYPPAKTARSGS